MRNLTILWSLLLTLTANATIFDTVIVEGNTTLSGSTANTVPYLNGSKVFTSSVVTPTELGYLSGVTSGIQSQLGAKEGTITATTSADYYRGDKTFQTLDSLAVVENTNLYFTDARARAAAIASSITDGDLTHAPDGNSVFDALALKQSTSQKDQNNGYAGLDAGGKIAVSALPNTVMTFEGQWNATTNTPALADGVGNAGDVYRANVAGSTDFGSGAIAFNLGDWAVYNGTIWEYAANSNLVMSVNGQQGVVVLDTDDISEGTNLYFTDARARTATVASSIVDSDLTHSPDGNSVFDALALKQDIATLFPFKAPTGILTDPPSYGFAGGDDDTGIYSTGDGNVSIQANGTLKASFDQNTIDLYSVTDVTVNSTLAVTADLNVTGNISAANYPPAGVNYGMAGFNASGVLYSIPNMYHTDYNGLYGTMQIPSSGDLNYLSLGSASGVSPAAINGIFINNQAESTGNTTLIDVNNSAPIGDDFAGLRIFNNANAGDGISMQSVGNSGDFGGQLRLMEASNSGNGPGGILYNIYNNGAMSGPFTAMQIGDGGNHTANSQVFNINKSGDTTGDANGLGIDMGGDATGNVTALTVGSNSNLVGGGYLGANIYSGNTVTGSSTMMSLSENGSSTNETGLNINLSGVASVSVVGANIDVSSATFAGQKTALQVQGGIFNSNSSVDTGDYTPSFFFNNNSLGGQLQIDSGSPITGIPGFGNNLGIVINFDDDATADNIIGAGNSIGYSVNGFVNQITGATGKTFDTVNYMFAGGSNPSGDGTIENLNFFRAAGLLNAGGNLTATNLRGFYVDPAFDGSVTTTNKWGFINASSTSENWFKKNVVVGGTTGLGESGVELDVDGEARIRSLTTAGYVTTDATGHLSSVAIPGTPVSSNITSNTTLSSATKLYFADTTGGAFTVTLPAASTNDGVSFTVKHVTFGGANDVTVAMTGGDTIEGAAGDTLTAGDVKVYISNGTNWYLAQ